MVFHLFQLNFLPDFGIAGLFYEMTCKKKILFNRFGKRHRYCIPLRLTCNMPRMTNRKKNVASTSEDAFHVRHPRQTRINRIRQIFVCVFLERFNVPTTIILIILLLIFLCFVLTYACYESDDSVLSFCLN